MIPGLPSLGGAELLILLAIILLFFGAKRVPQLGRSLGSGVRQFRQGLAQADSGEDKDEEIGDRNKQEFREGALEDSEEAEELREGKENEELSSSRRGETRAEEARARAEHEEEGNTDRRTEQQR
jgi:sec-independent protein translocase protein TatA